MVIDKYFKILYTNFFSDKIQKRSERLILVIAIASFLIHLAIIGMVDYGIISLNKPSDLLINPIAAIYTPFHLFLYMKFTS